MTLFFLVVGLEAKRELDLGELRERRRPGDPGAGGARRDGGWRPRSYLAINAGGDGARGWGTAVSTDTALALGALALLTRGRAIRLRVFLLTLVVIDDLVGAGRDRVRLHRATSPSSAARRSPSRCSRVARRAALAPARWRGPAAVARRASGSGSRCSSPGVDAVIAGLAIGLVTSAYPPPRDDLERSTELTRSFREQPTPELAYSARAQPDLGDLAQRAPAVPPASVDEPGDRAALRARQRRASTSTATCLRRAVTLAGDARHRRRLRRRQAARHPRRRLAGDPAGARRPRPPVTWPALAGGGAVAGIGFTVSLLVASLAFSGPLLERGEDRRPRHRDLLCRRVAWLAVRVSRAARRRRAAAPARAHGRDAHRPRRRRRPRARPRPRAPPSAGDAPRVRRLRVPVLRPGRADHPRAARRAPATTCATSSGTCRSTTCTPTPRPPPRPRRRPAAQGAFWAMHDVLLAHQEELTPPDLLRYAAELGLDVDRFADECARAARRARRARRRERRRQRRLRHADVLRQRPPPPGRLRRRHAHRRRPRGQVAGALRRRGVHRSLTAACRPLVVARRLQVSRVA